MQFKQTLVRLALFLSPLPLFSQTTYLPQEARENVLLERMEIKAGKDSVLNFSKTRPFSRKEFIPRIEQYYRMAAIIKGAGETPMSDDPAQQKANDIAASFTNVDVYNMHMAMVKNSEWLQRSYTFSSKRPLGPFYKTPANLLEVASKDFFLAVNPVFQYVVGKEDNNSQRIFLNTRGVTLRGRIANKIGFATYLGENQERDPLYVQQWVAQRQAVPGQGFYQDFKTSGYDYFDARGYITTNVTKYIDVVFGYDKNFIGNGYRSLFLSDLSNNALFLKLNTRIWKFNYENLFMELQAAQPRKADQLISKKYAAMHHLDAAVTRWLNIGLFEGVIFGRKDHFDFSYLNPVIFYRSIEQQNGSPDNAVAGLDFKANALKHIQLYGQFLLDEFKLKEIRDNRGWWANKWGLQMGAKYIDAFTVKNLDLQVETNRVRPFTYSHGDSVANYTHYNQPLAHPLGANFQEWIGIARYQPAPRWFVQAKAIYYKQGRDTSAASWGSNIFLPNTPPYRQNEYGYTIGGGLQTKVAYTSLLLSYELRPNLFLEGNAVFRKERAATVADKNTTVIYAGIRWNMQRREFDF